MISKIHLLLLMSLFSVAFLQADDFRIVKNGRGCAQIILSPAVDVYDSYAAVELSTYVEKLTGVRLPISFTPKKGLREIRLTHSSRYLPAPAAARWYLLKNDGFMLYVTGDHLYIASRQPAGVVYGACEILKQYGGIRWLYPGEDGESYSTMKDLSVPEQLTVSNPSLIYRDFLLTGCPPGPIMTKTIQWELRNNLSLSYGFLPVDRYWGGHDFWTYLPKELFKTRPELFPMKDGKRHATHWNMKNPGYTNPCVSNPETMKIMCDNVIRTLALHRDIKWLNLLQNDTPFWCECENCRRLDSTLDLRTKAVSNRYWIYANQVTDAVKKAFPSIRINAYAYINAENPPDRVMPDKRIDTLQMVTIRRCFTHSMGDSSCPVNRRYRERLLAWKKLLGCKLKAYECTPMIPQGTRIYNPIEKVLAEDIRFYHKNGVVGYRDERPPIIDNPKKYFIKCYYPNLAYSWYYDAFPRYFQARFLWDVNADFDDVMEDYGSRFYENAWKYMKPYRTLLRKCYENSGLHFAYGGPGIMVGQCISNKADRTELGRLLREARRTAANNPRVLQRIDRDIEGFKGMEWRYEEYAAKEKMTREIRFINGDAPSEEDWDRAQTVSDFRKSKDVPAEFATSAKVLYSRDRIFFRIHASEPQPEKMITRKKNNDDKIWEDNDLEIFIAPPALNGRYLHLAFNAAGVKFDAMTLHATDSDIGFDSQAEIKTRILKDAWTADVAIPFSVLGGSPSGHDLWPVNITRSRLIAENGGTSGAICSWSNGTFHGTTAFRNMKFTR